MNWYQIIWLGLLLVFIIVEAVSVSLVSIWFAAGALVALLISLVAPEAIILQGMAFLLVSLLALLLLRPMAQKLVRSKRVPTNADAAIGKTAKVISDIVPGHFGRVNLEGQDWTARSEYTLPAGSWCHVDAIEGVKLVVSPLPGQ